MSSTAEKISKAVMILVPILIVAALFTAAVSTWLIVSQTYNFLLTLSLSLFGYAEWVLLGLAIALWAKSTAWNVPTAMTRLCKVVVAVFVANFVVNMTIGIPSMVSGFQEGMDAGLRGERVDQEALTLRLYAQYGTFMLAMTVVSVLLKLFEGLVWLQTRSRLARA